MPHINALDGIRALAIVPVIFFHLGLLPVGWVGVQVFFVLSGYLITKILIEAKETNPVSAYLARFYWRRALRIFPLYFVFLVVAATSFSAFREDWPWLATYTANFARLRQIDLHEPFVHLWSLAVEEQFYFVWPFVVYFASAGTLRRLIVVILLVAPLSRLCLFVAFHQMPEDWLGRAIYSIPTSQVDAFAAGAMLVLFKFREALRSFMLLLIVMAAAGSALIAHQHLAYHSAIKWSFGYSMFLLQDGGFVWGYSLLNLTAAFGLLCATVYNPKFLEAYPIRRIGVISYGIYVYHLPLLIALRQTSINRVIFIPAYLVLTYLIAEASYRWLETPLLKLKNNQRIVRIGRAPS